MIPIIDTHQHLWDLDRLSLSWIKGLELMNRSYLMSDYLKAAEGTGIEKTVYMEVNVDPECIALEVEQMTEYCRSPGTPMQALVISLDPMAKNFKDDLKRQAANPHVRGVRSVLHIPQTGPGYCLQEDFILGVRELGHSGLIFDICIRPANLPDAVKLVESSPETIFVIDHCGNADPHIVNGDTDPGSEPTENPFWHTALGWKDQMSALAGSQNTICKISGIVARAQAGVPRWARCLKVLGLGPQPLTPVGVQILWHLPSIIALKSLDQSELFLGGTGQFVSLELNF